MWTRAGIKKFLAVVFMTATVLSHASELNVKQCSTPPKIDGLLNDDCWKGTGPAGQFYNKTDSKASDDTKVYICHDSAYLYMAFRNINENMKHVRPLVFTKDSKVYTDDSVEVFIDPGTDNKSYYHFVLNHSNVKADGKGTDFNWNCTWLSATSRDDEGWSAEIAIPLVLLKDGDLSKAKICVGRNKRDIVVHVVDGPIGENVKYLTMTPEQTHHKPETFTPIKWEGDMKKLQTPFIPGILKASVKGYFTKEGKLYYPVELRTVSRTAKPGKALLKVVETVKGEKPKTVSRQLEIFKASDLRLEIPTDDYRSRAVSVSLENPETGEVYEQLDIEDVSVLEAMKTPVVEHSFYTSEKNVRIKCGISLPAEQLQTATLKVLSNGKILCELKTLEKETIVELSLDKFKMGKSRVLCELALGGRTLIAAEAVITRLQPKPGHEVKIDNFKRIILKDGKPLFILGVITGMFEPDDAIYAKIKEFGYNSITPGPSVESRFEDIARATSKHGLYILPMSSVNHALSPIPEAAERKKVYPERFQKYWDATMKNIFVPAASMDNVIGYYGVDEINLLDSEGRIYMESEFYKKAKEADPYKPIYCVFSRHIPEGARWTDPMDVIMPDLYTRPGNDKNIAEMMACLPPGL